MPGRFDVSDYVDVQERITRFWAEYPDGRLQTQMMSEPGDFDRVVFVAAAYKHLDHTQPDATGWAAETKGGGGANATSWHENGETSAIGRALANLGYATSGKDRPSRQEMGKANRAPEPPEKPATPRNAVESSTPPAQMSREDMARVVELKEVIAAARNRRDLTMLGKDIANDSSLTNGVRAAIRPVFTARQQEVG